MTSPDRDTIQGDALFNPKSCGLFGQLDMQGILRKRSLTPPNFTLEQQTEYHMKADLFF